MLQKLSTVTLDIYCKNFDSMKELNAKVKL